MRHPAFMCSVALVASILVACTVYQPSLVHPKLGALTDIDRAMDCTQINLAIDRADTVRWLIRDDGGRLETTSERHARYAGNVIIALPLSLLLRGPAFIPSPGHHVLDAADARIRELLQLKFVRGCPPRPTALPGIDEFMLLTQLGPLQAKIDAGTGDEAALFKERTRLLDGLRLVPEPVRTLASPQPSVEAARVEVPEPIPAHEESAASLHTDKAPLPARMPRVGDTWTYRYTDLLLNRTSGPFIHQIVAVSPKQIREQTRFPKNPDVGIEHIFTRNVELVETTLSGMPAFAPYLQAFDALESLATAHRVLVNGSTSSEWVFSCRLSGPEVIEVPGGRFAATRVEVTGNKQPSGPTGGQMVYTIDPRQARFVLWYSPEVKRIVKYTRETFNWNGMRLDRDMYELLDRSLK